MKYHLLIIVLFFCGVSCSQQLIDYDLNSPNSIVELPVELDEISGLTIENDSTLATVQDEKGNVYFINTTSGEIIEVLDFGKPGDYEGITKHKEHFYVLRSDGTLFKIKREGEVNKVKFKHPKGFDFEGLCLDKKNERLLVACKQHREKKKNEYIYIYGYSLKEEAYLKKPVFKIKKKGIHKNFKPSGIAIHPNGDIYILSSHSKTLLVLNALGEKKEVIALSKRVFLQAEGITIYPNGDLYISNEKNTHVPTLVKFELL